jgi:hypothetical protein
LVLAAIVAALVVPVGFALSVPSGTGRPSLGVRTGVPVEAIAMAAPVLITGNPAEKPLFDDVPDSAKLLLVGTILLGVAVAVRKVV